MIDYTPKFKIGDIIDVVDPGIPSYEWGYGEVTEVEQRDHGGITAKFKYGKAGFFFSAEITLISRKNNEKTKN